MENCVRDGGPPSTIVPSGQCGMDVVGYEVLRQLKPVSQGHVLAEKMLGHRV